MLVTHLSDTLSPAERNLVRMGEHQRLRDTRAFFQYATVSEFCEPVERLTGRRVQVVLQLDRHGEQRRLGRVLRAAPGKL